MVGLCRGINEDFGENVKVVGMRAAKTGEGYCTASMLVNCQCLHRHLQEFWRGWCVVLALNTACCAGPKF